MKRNTTKRKILLEKQKKSLQQKPEEISTNGETYEAQICDKPRKKATKGTFCGVCDKKFRSRYHLNLHMAVHTGEKNYICGLCKKGYQQKWNLVTHVARVHSKEKPFKCNDCGKAFGYSSHFKRHVKTHFLEKIEAPETVKKRILNPHKCQLCEKSFESNYRLNLHMRVHTGNRPFICDKCGKSFTSKRLCAFHMKKKHQESPLGRSSHLGSGHSTKKQSNETTLPSEKTNEQATYQMELIPCEVCGKNINRKSMKKHLNIHYRTRIYSCSFCNKEFLESGQRMVHERKHTGEKPYLCDICGRPHTQYGNLLTHRKRYHNLTEKTPNLWKRNDPSKKVQKNTSKTIDSSTDSQTDESTWCKHSSLEKYEQLIGEKANSEENDSKKDNQVTETSITDTSKNCPNPKYTGNETIQEFLEIASTWANKKFEESKEKFKEVRNSHESSLVKESEDDFGWSVDSEVETERSIEVEGEKEKDSVKEIKTKIKRIIYEKIVEDLRESDAKSKVLQVVDKINEMSKQKDTDELKQFIKEMKSVPDNIVMRTNDGKLFWHCWMCESKLRSRHLLARHLVIHEPEENRPYKCDVCQKTFTQSNNLKEHAMSHYNEHQYYCEKCGSGFRHKTHFNVHMRKHDPATAVSLPKKYECSFCGKKVHTNYQKMEHERTHTKERPYLCKICGQQFGTSSTLNRHQSTHSGATHQCTICLKFFRQKSSLKRHYGTHSQYPYSRVSCECGKTFSQSPSLKKHKMICKNRSEPVVKPFGCVICVKRFLTKSDLKRHVATHESLKRFRCSICLIYLKTDETFKRHMKKHDEIQMQEKVVV